MASDTTIPATSGGAVDSGSAAPDAGAVDSSSVSGTDSDSTPNGTPEAVELEPSVTADTFGWDDWDGSEDAFPEDVRPWASKFNGHYQKQLELTKSEANKLKSIYESLMEGREDPRLSEYKTQLETAGQTKQELEQNFQRLQTQHQSTIKEFNDFMESRAQQAAEAFQKENPWIFESQELQGLGSSLLDEGFETNDLPQLLRMPEGLLGATRKIHKELTAAGAKGVGPHAIKLARSEFRAPPPSPSASKVAGAHGSTPSTAIPSSPGQDATLQDTKVHAVRRALRLDRS